MLAGKLYDAGDPELMKERLRAHDLRIMYNSAPESDMIARTDIINKLLPPKKGIMVTRWIHIFSSISALIILSSIRAFTKK